MNGVLQGSVLGLILFSLFINDLEEWVTSLLTKFADNTKMGVVASTEEQKENCRPDGRDLGEFRTTTVNIGSITTADGSALVKLGNTTVICGIKAEFAAPPVDSSHKGYIVPNVDLPPLCSSRFRPGPPGEEAQAASQFLADVIENSQVVLKEDLCIADEKENHYLYSEVLKSTYFKISSIAALPNLSLLRISRLQPPSELITESSTKRLQDTMPEDEPRRSEGVQCATGEEQRASTSSARKNEVTGSKLK
ncbi:Exosome complex component RRP43 [Varanus komodoensis]|nr:Exosome complex component RRP43 [Varanus komodoensis]